MAANKRRLTLADLKPDPKNARKHTDRNVGMIETALHEVGAARSIVIDEHDVILAGNATVKAAGNVGLRKLRVIDAAADELIAVRRSGLTKKQKTRLALFDNRAAELAEWDVDVLGSLDDDALAGMFDDDELAELLGPVDGETDPDDFDAEAEAAKIGEPITQPGDLWKLGRHRLMCGDSTKADDVARLMGGNVPNLMVTDPPYGVEYTPQWRNEVLREANRAVGKVTHDDRADWSAAYSLFRGDVAYIWHAGRFACEVASSLVRSRFEIRCQIIWAKQHFVISRGNYHWQHEPCWFAVRKGASASWSGDRKQTTLWAINNGLSQNGGHEHIDDPTGHGTQKPVECMARPIRNHSGDVYEPFAGSGSTLIAAEQLRRTCFAMEISPKYCDVIVKRWETFTGKTAKRER